MRRSPNNADRATQVFTSRSHVHLFTSGVHFPYHLVTHLPFTCLVQVFALRSLVYFRCLLTVHFQVVINRVISRLVTGATLIDGSVIDRGHRDLQLTATLS